MNCSFDSLWNLNVGFTASQLDEADLEPVPTETDDLLLLASQNYESHIGAYGSVCHRDSEQSSQSQLQDSEVNDLLAVSQCSEPSSEPVANQHPDKSSTLRRFGDPVTSASVEQSRRQGVPPAWCCRVWAAWAKERNTLPEADQQEASKDLGEDITVMSIENLQCWLPKFVLEVRTLSSRHIVWDMCRLTEKP